MGNRFNCNVSILFAAAIMLTGVLLVSAQDVSPAPTLVRPTLVPTVPPQSIDTLPGESAISRLVADGQVRVGILYNEPPFGELNIRGDTSGFDADLARALGEAWGVTTVLSQVTRQTGVDQVLAGEIDLLIAAQPHLRELDGLIEFSEAYYPSEQVMVVRDGDAAQALPEMAGRTVGYILGTRSETALQYWTARTGVTVTPVQFVNQDQALTALTGGTIDGLIANRVHMQRAVTEPGIIRMLAEPVMREPFAIGMRRQDANLRALVDRTLHFFDTSGRLNEIHRANFSDVDYPPNAIIPWLNVGESAPTAADAPSNVPFPSQYVVPRLQAERTLRVAGIRDVPPDAPESVRRLDAVHRSLINEIARRWNVTVVYVPDDGTSPVDQVANGQADLAVGVQPDWNLADRVDFSEPYLMHGYQLLFETSAGINGFGDLRGKAVGIFSDEPDADEVLRAQAEAARAIVNDVYQLANESDVAFAILAATDLNLTAVLADSIRLLPHQQNNPDTLSFLTDANGRPVFFTRNYLALATPRNDVDFSLLLDYTLQEMLLEGVLQSMMAPVSLPDAIPEVEIWPGPSSYLGFDLAGS